MRTTADRIRHAVSFEVIALCIVAPAGAWIFGFSVEEIGILSLIGATIATIWNYVYNLLFDHVMAKIYGSVRKSVTARVVHAILFEAGLLVVFLPIIAWHLGLTLMQAFLMDISFSAFYLVYAFVFNWMCDIIFPVPEPATQES